MNLQKYETLTNMIEAELDQLGRNKVELADAVDVDPSTINRNLSGETVASYPRLRSIIEVLDDWGGRQNQNVKDIMIRKFTSTHLNETRREAADKMIRGDFSQLPVRENEDGEIVGIVTDSDLTKVHDDAKSVGEIGYHHLIRVESDTSRQLIEDILDEGHSGVLIVEDESPIGFITKYDLLLEGPELE